MKWTESELEMKFYFYLNAVSRDQCPMTQSPVDCNLKQQDVDYLYLKASGVIIKMVFFNFWFKTFNWLMK